MTFRTEKYRIKKRQNNKHEIHRVFTCCNQSFFAIIIEQNHDYKKIIKKEEHILIENYYPKIFTYQREMCPLKGCSLGLREEKGLLLTAVSGAHKTAVSQTTCNENHENA